VTYCARVGDKERPLGRWLINSFGEKTLFISRAEFDEEILLKYIFSIQ